MCRTWNDHEWGEPRVVAAGRHPTQGYWQRVSCRCTRDGCDRELTVTHWPTPSSVRPEPQQTGGDA